MGGIATLDSYGPGRNIALIPYQHLEFLEGCLDFHETDTHIFVHANYDPDLSMTEQLVGMMRWESLRDTIPGPYVSGKTVIVGHTPQKGGEILGDQGACVIAKSYEMKATRGEDGGTRPRKMPKGSPARRRGRGTGSNEGGAVLP